MDRKVMMQVLGVAVFVLGAISFLAIPPHSKTTHYDAVTAHFPVGDRIIPALDSTITCERFGTSGACSSNFWLRTGVFVIAAVAGGLLLLAGHAASASSALGGHVVGFSGSSMSGQRPTPTPPRPTTTAPAAALSAAPNAATDASTSATPPGDESKTCPDCAEQVRFIARKCRFCGYQFSDVGGQYL